jgi:hypothetical protein
MIEIVNFIKENYVSIAVIISVVFALLIIISIREWDLNPPKPESKLIQEVVVETFLNENNENIDDIKKNKEKSNISPEIAKEIKAMKLNPSDSFCESHLGKSAELEKSCHQLTQDGCAQTTCCIWTQSANASKCRAGNVDGPIFKKDAKGNLISMDTYYYQGIKYNVSN